MKYALVASNHYHDRRFPDVFILSAMTETLLKDEIRRISKGFQSDGLKILKIVRVSQKYMIDLHEGEAHLYDHFQEFYR